MEDSRSGKPLCRQNSFGSGVEGLDDDPAGGDDWDMSSFSRVGKILGLSPQTVRREIRGVRSNQLKEAAAIYLDETLRASGEADLSQLTLERVLKTPEHFQMFRLYCEMSACGESTMFYTRVLELEKTRARKASNTAAIALNIYLNFLAPGAPSLLKLPAAALERTKTLLLEHDPNTFASALLVAKRNMSAVFTTQYIAFLEQVMKQPPEAPKSPRQADAVRKMLTDDESEDPRMERTTPSRPDASSRIDWSSPSSSSSSSMTLSSPPRVSPRPDRAPRLLLTRRHSKAGDVLGLSSLAMENETVLVRRHQGTRLQETTESVLRSGRRPAQFTSSNMPLDTILHRSPAHLKLLMLFAESRYSADALLFWLRVREFKAMVDVPQEVLNSRALNIWRNFVSSKGEHQVIISAPVFNATREALLNGDITLNVYDECYREAYSVIAFSLFPEYLLFLNRAKAGLAPMSPKRSPRTEDEDASMSSDGTSFSFSGVKRQHHSSEDTALDVSTDTNTSGVDAGHTNISPTSGRPRSATSESIPYDLKSVHQYLKSGGKDPPTSATRTFEDCMSSAPCRSRFEVFCESISEGHFLRFVQRVDAWKETPTSAGLSIWGDFLAQNAPTPVLPEAHPAVLELRARIGAADTTPDLFDAVRELVLAHLETMLFPEFQNFLLRVRRHQERVSHLRRSMSFTSAPVLDSSSEEGSPIISGPVSLTQCLRVGHGAFSLFLAFAEKQHCEELLLFWREVCHLEALPADATDDIFDACMHIYETYVNASSVAHEVNLSSKNYKEIQFDVENCLVRQDMFEAAKAEVHQIIAQDVYPRFVLTEAKKPTGPPRPLSSEDPIRPHVATLLSLVEANKKYRDQSHFTAGLSLSKAARYEWSDFRLHPFFEEGGILRLIVCSVALNKAAHPSMVVSVEAKCRGHVLEVTLVGPHRETIGHQADLVHEEAVTLLNAFAAVHEHDFVTSYQPPKAAAKVFRKRMASVSEDHL